LPVDANVTESLPAPPVNANKLLVFAANVAATPPVFALASTLVNVVAVVPEIRLVVTESFLSPVTTKSVVVAAKVKVVALLSAPVEAIF
jgi:hypothetical protein